MSQWDVENMTTSEVLQKLQRYYPSFEDMWLAIHARRADDLARGSYTGSASIAYDLLASLETRRCANGSC